MIGIAFEDFSMQLILILGICLGRVGFLEVCPQFSHTWKQRNGQRKEVHKSKIEMD